MADEESTIETSDARSVSLYHDWAKWRLGEQIGRGRALDAMLAATFTLSAAMIAVFSAAIALTAQDLSWTARGLLISVVAVFVLDLALSAAAYRIARWSLRPDLQALKSSVGQVGHAKVQEWAADEMVEAIEANEPKLKRKGRYVAGVVFLSAVNAALVALTSVVVATIG